MGFCQSSSVISLAVGPVEDHLRRAPLGAPEILAGPEAGVVAAQRRGRSG